jgi:ABC-type lipoprotein release transport system permease subunit
MKRIVQSLAARARSARVVATISFRNLVRQFRRNLLLGIGIAVSMCVLVVTASFTSGLSDILFNRVLVYMTGHIGVQEMEYTTRRTDVIRDKDRIIAVIKKNVEGIKSINESVGVFARTIGNGKTGMAFLVGLDRNSDFYDQTQLEKGDPRDIYKPNVFPGVILYKNAARDLNVGLADIITARFQTIYGQNQAVKFKVVGIIPSENMFMDVAAFVDSEVLRRELNMGPQEVIGLEVVTDYPENSQKVIAMANRLHDALAPQAAGVQGTLTAGDRRADAQVFALELNSKRESRTIASQNLRFLKGDLSALIGARNGIILSEILARSLGAKVGTKLAYSYAPKFANQDIRRQLVVTGIVQAVPGFAENAAFANEEVFYDTFFWNLPEKPAVVAHDAALFPALLPEWEVLERSHDTAAAQKKMFRLNREPWKGARLDVRTMFETASAIVDLQRSLNLVSVIAVLVLFFVILIGVVNTMRMSIRERTREIGTNRAIGMQRSDVRSVFVLEVVFLAIVAAGVGILLGFGVMSLLSSFTIELRDNPFSMFFVNKHLHFVPTPLVIISNFVIIVVIAFLIAFFTARRAARLRAAEALRHYE